MNDFVAVVVMLLALMVTYVIGYARGGGFDD